MSGTLYLVGTPIGNLGDLSPRAAEILESVDFIAAEDTRVTLKLLNHLGIKKQLISYYEHNKIESAAVIIPRLLGGESCALVSDAGMPAISDPGEELVRLCAERGIQVASVPGPSAVVTALAMSGLPTQRFTFEGFLSTAGKSRREHLASLKNEHRTIVIYEAPHKLSETLKDLLEALGADQAPRGGRPHHPGCRRGAICRGAPPGGVRVGDPGRPGGKGSPAVPGGGHGAAG